FAIFEPGLGPASRTEMMDADVREIVCGKRGETLRDAADGGLRIGDDARERFDAARKVVSRQGVFALEVTASVLVAHARDAGDQREMAVPVCDRPRGWDAGDPVGIALA